MNETVRPDRARRWWRRGRHVSPEAGDPLPDGEPPAAQDDDVPPQARARSADAGHPTIREYDMRDDMLTTILSELNGSNVDIEASAVISADGLMMASLLPSGLEEDRIGAMSAAILALGGRTAAELERGDLEQVLIKGNNGFVLLTQAGTDAVLAVMTRATAKLGLIFLDVRRAAEKITKIL